MAEPLWTSDEIAAATGGRPSGEAFAATGVSIDTRSLESGDLFVALAGARDGHEFVALARSKGAAGCLVSKPSLGGEVVVPDTLKGLEALGMAARDGATAARRAAVTGSVGKTSATRAIAAGLALAGPSHASVKSFNNHIGVPLTLARMPRATKRAVFEVGMNHAGEIAPLSRMIAPHVVLITTVGPVHIENFDDGETGVARAKAEIFEGLTADGIAVLNADDRWFSMLAEAAAQAGAQVVTFGGGPDCDARLLGFAADAASGGAVVRARLHGREISFPIRQSGVHWGLNSLAVLLTLEALDVGLDTGLAALAAFAPIEGRGAEQTVPLAGGAFTLVDESYNANPMSMAAALKSLGLRAVTGRRIVALTDMLELGPEAPAFHAAIAPALEQAGVDLVFCAGPLMKSLWQALPATRQGGYAETAAALAPLVVRAIEPDDVVMVKGSNGSNAGAVTAALAAMTDAGSIEGGRR